MDEPTLLRWRRARTAFGELLDSPDELRNARIDEIAHGDEQLASDLRTLLAQVEPEQDDAPAEDGTNTADRLGTIISGRFRLLRRIGSGGMGEVYLAGRTDELDQKVALKLVRSDLPVPIERARREQQILARLAHPNIAGLVDAGVTGAGQPWFAMDYVDGERITDWCNHRSLTLDQRVRLVAEVCRAVQFAHRNLILHRDIKPSNVLVDTEGNPKLLDFGIAKLLDGTDAQQTQTLALTPAYAAPEQLRGEAATTASDIYQLGLLLYELLAGMSAHSARESAQSRGETQLSLPRIDLAYAKVMVQDAQRAADIARERGNGTDKLRRILKSDLGRIVAKATADDPRERYETAQELAEDLDRWVERMPVRAHRGSFAYRARKLVRRHRAAAAIIAALAIGLAASTVVALQQARAEHAQRQAADTAREHAERQRQRAETLLGFMNDVFRQADPQNAGDADLNPAQMLERAAATLSARQDLDPVTHAALMRQVADTFNSLFLPERALASAEQAIAALEPLRDRQPEEYLGSVVVALDALQMLDRSEAQLALVAHALPFARLQPRGAQTWVPGLLKFRGAAYCSVGNYRDCAADLRESVNGAEANTTSGPNATVTALNQLAVLMSDQGNANESARLLRRAQAELTQSASALKADMSTFQHNLASALFTQGHYQEAIERLETSLADIPALFGADAQFVSAIIQRSLSRCYAMVGNYERARSLIDGVLAGLTLDPERSGSARHVMQSHIVAAKIELDLGDTSSAIARLDQLAQRFADDTSGLDFMTLRVDTLRGEALVRNGSCKDARVVLESARARLQALIAGDPSWIAGEIADSLGRCAMADGNHDLADREFASAIDQFRSATGATSPSTLRSRIHRVLAGALAHPARDELQQLEADRAALIDTLGSAERLSIWQLDLIMADLAEHSGTPVDASRVAQAGANLRHLTGQSSIRTAAGISSFN